MPSDNYIFFYMSLKKIDRGFVHVRATEGEATEGTVSEEKLERRRRRSWRRMRFSGVDNPLIIRANHYLAQIPPDPAYLFYFQIYNHCTINRELLRHRSLRAVLVTWCHFYPDFVKALYSDDERVKEEITSHKDYEMLVNDFICDGGWRLRLTNYM